MKNYFTKVLRIILSILLLISVLTPVQTFAEGGKIVLDSLSLSSGELSPAFDPQITDYTVNVDNNVESIALTAVCFQPGTLIMLNGTGQISGEESKPVNLETGENKLEITISAHGYENNTYLINVIRAGDSSSTSTPTDTPIRTLTPGPEPSPSPSPTPIDTDDPQLNAFSNNAALSNLVISAGTLTPVFAADTLQYTVTTNVGSVTITPTVSDVGATIQVNGLPVNSGSPSQDIPLSLGSNIIIISVLAQYGMTSKSYTITVTRKEGDWQTVASGLSVHTVTTPGFSIDGGTPYTVIVSGYGGSGVYTKTVYKYNGVAWEPIGGALQTWISGESLYVYNGVPYVALVDASGTNIYVRRYNGTEWEPVGTNGFDGCNYNISSLSLYIYNGTPYIAFIGDSKARLAKMSHWAHFLNARFEPLRAIRGNKKTTAKAVIF